MKERFKNPGTDYRPIPFWSWNESLRPEILREQIRQMADKGMGGYFMHARGGLTVEYLGEEWFDCIAASIDEGRKCGLDAWVYDDEGWPSGFAGGIVPKMSESYQAKFLNYTEYDKTEEADLENVYQVYVLGGSDPYRRIAPESISDGSFVLGEGERLAVVSRIIQRTYIDVMNKKAVEAFLQVTHEEYYKRFGKEFGKAMKGFFTDEPRFTCNRFGDMPWSEGLCEEYEKRYGESLKDTLLSLWQPCGKYEKVRYQFWKMVNDLFVHSYMETLYSWCEEHDCMLTGHIMMEESIFGQMTGTGGVMPCYEYEHIPGIDWLRRRIESPVIGKQVGSVACQLGRKRVITESFALSGWDISFEQMKWILEWQYVNGVNLLCQHLAAYSLKGSRKRDYPPSFFHQQSWWKEFKYFTDYVGRLGVALAEGNQLADVLVIHPMRSGYVCYDGGRPQSMRDLDTCFREVSELLSGEHLSYHYGDETIMEKYGRVEGRKLVVGEISYRTVILPHMYALDESTLKLLISFAEGGGTILYTGAFPSYTNGAQELLDQMKQYARKTELGDLRTTLASSALISTGISENGREIGSIGQQLRQTEEGLMLFLVNHSEKESHQALVTAYGIRGSVWLLSAEDGERVQIPAKSGEDTSFTLPFLPMQSYLVLIRPEEAPEQIRSEETETVRVKPAGAWSIEEMGRNSLTLDICRYRIDGGELEGSLPVIKLMKLLLDRQKDSSVELEYEFTIHMDRDRNKEFLLAMEDADKYRLSVNGVSVPCEITGWWKDRSFQTIDIRPYIKEGKNTLRLEGVFHQDPYVYEVLYGKGMYETEKNKLTYNMEMESVYLIGDFGVVSRSAYTEGKRNSLFTEGPFEIVDRPEGFAHPEFVKQGLPFFAEELKVSQSILVQRKEGKRVLLEYGRLHAPAAEVFVNGSKVKTAVWAPYEADITEFCEEGENTLAIRFLPSNRNFLGPHHHTSGESYRVGPMSFSGKWSWVERRTEADATDFEDKTRDYWRDGYSFVRLGLE